MKSWLPNEVKTLHQMIKNNAPVRVIALKLNRPLEEIFTKAKQDGINLQIPDQELQG